METASTRGLIAVWRWAQQACYTPNNLYTSGDSQSAIETEDAAEAALLNKFSPEFNTT